MLFIMNKEDILIVCALEEETNGELDEWNVIYTGVNLIGKHRLFDQSVPGSIKLDYYFFGDRDRHMPKDFEVTRQKFGGCIFYGKECHLCQQGRTHQASYMLQFEELQCIRKA